MCNKMANVRSTILALVFFPKIATPQPKYIAVSLRAGKTMCESYETSHAGMEVTYEESNKGRIWNTPTRQCTWALNRDTWTSPRGKKGVWAFICTVKPGSGGQKKRIDDHEDNGCKCGLVPPSTKPQPDIKIRLEDDCKHGDRQPSTFLNNYHSCEKTSKGRTFWMERTCGSNFFWDQQQNKCVQFDELPLEIQQQYCQHGCVDRCAGGQADTTNRSIEFPTWPDQPPTCTECDELARRPNIEYCKNYRICSSGWTWNEYWDDFVCPPRTPFWHQMTSCRGECKKWVDLPQSLKEYYIAHPCCPTPDKKTTRKISHGTENGNQNKNKTTTHLNEKCECKLRGYCKWFEMCIDGVWSRYHLCSHDLYWLPNKVTGGTCTHFDSLPQELQTAYKSDSHCYQCKWYQEVKDVCSPNYTFRDRENVEHKMSCPASPTGNKLYWQMKLLTCDECWFAVDNFGRPCKC